MIEFFELLSNREISILIWTIIFFGFLIIYAKVSFRKILSILKLLFSKQFIPFYLVIGLYFFLIITVFIRLFIWEFSLYKDFIYWLLSTGIILFFNSNNLKTYKDFTKVILTAISATIILEFIIGFYNFSLFWELILIPTISILSLLSIVAGTNRNEKNSQLIARILNNVLAIIGFGLLAFSIYNLVISYNELFTVRNLKSLLLPPLFTLIFLPLIYVTVLYMKYELLFISLNRYQFLTSNRKKKIKFSILKYANIKFHLLEKANKIILFNKSELHDESNIEFYIREKIKLK